MANEIMKEIKTRIALRTGDYAYWTTGAGKDIELLKGEVCICTIAVTDNQAQTAPTVLFKVCDVAGKKFADLKWTSALAADVYEWAKTANLYIETDGAGNAITSVSWDATLNGNKGGLKFTKGETFATKGELDDLREGLEADTNTTYNFSIPVDGEDKGKLLVEKKEIGETTWTKVDAYDFVTPDELDETLKGYYTKEEADKKFVTGLAEGSTNGTVKAVINGVPGDDINVHGLESAAYVTVDSLNATAKEYADAVLGTAADEAGAQTVHGANKLAAAAKARIDAFIDGTAEAESAIDTLVEIQQYMTSDTQAFTALSERVTDIENGTTVTTAGDLTAALEEEIKGYTVDNAEKFGNQLPAYYATKASVDAIPGAIDAKITAYDTSKNFGDIITHNVAEFATSTENGAKELAQGVKDVVDANKETWDKADTALQNIEVGTGLTVTNKVTGEGEEAVTDPTTKVINIDEEVIFVLDCNY